MTRLSHAQSHIADRHFTERNIPACSALADSSTATPTTGHRSTRTLIRAIRKIVAMRDSVKETDGIGSPRLRPASTPA
jgi:hypothetical protein